MASYEAWNQAIIEHVTVGIPLGSMVYLAIDEEIIATIGRGLTGGSEEGLDHVADFKRAVRDRVVIQGARIVLGDILRPSRNGLPNGVGFLSLMVLAASHMAEDETEGAARRHENDYFRRLRALLDLEQKLGRPDGLHPGDEEPLWANWNRWLQEAGFVPTGRPGPEGPRRFINYPISQTLLRQADKDRLRDAFSQMKWQADSDGETLLYQLRNRTDLRKRNHLGDLLSDPGSRHQTLSDLLYDLHSSWQESTDEINQRGRSSNSTLRCRLLRDYDPIFGVIAYRLYPRTPAARQSIGGRLVQGDEEHLLEVERPGWFAALNDVTSHELTRGANYPVTGINGVSRAVLPERSFWVLVPDSEEPDNGVYASWRPPTLGEPAIVLIAKGTFPLLQELAEEGLVNWDGEPHPIASLNDEWLEVRNCLVMSSAGGVFGDAQALFEELRPATSLGISTRGGLRSPDRRGWIVGHGPQVTVSGFDDQVELRVTRIEDDHVAIAQLVTCMEPQTLGISTPGTYRIDASAGGHEATPRLVRLVNWEQLTSAKVVDYSAITIGDNEILGATLHPITKAGV